MWRSFLLILFSCNGSGTLILRSVPHFFQLISNAHHSFEFCLLLFSQHVFCLFLFLLLYFLDLLNFLFLLLSTSIYHSCNRLLSLNNFRHLRKTNIIGAWLVSCSCVFFYELLTTGNCLLSLSITGLHLAYSCQVIHRFLILFKPL